jgi:hypothetical protein
MITILWTQLALAQTHQQKICVDVVEDFEDFAPHADRWSGNADRVVRGIKIGYKRTAVWPQQPMDAAFSAESGPDMGCRTVPMVSGGTYQIRIYAHARTRGYDIIADDQAAFQNDTGNFINVPVVGPASPSTINITVPWGETGFAEILVASWMATKAGHLGFGTWPGHTRTNGEVIPPNRIYYYTESWRDQAYATVEDGYDNLPAHISPVGSFNEPSRFIITHETAHWLTGMLDEQQNAYFDMDADLLGCNGAPWNGSSGVGSHQLFQTEWQTAASNEGIADFVVAWAFNNVWEDDCSFAIFGNYDTDLDGVRDWPGVGGLPPEDNQVVQMSCQGFPWDANDNGVVDAGEPVNIPSFVSPTDWLEDMVNANRCDYSYPGVITGRSNEYDWMRYYWDLSREGHSIKEILALHDRANPRNWADFGALADTPKERYDVAAYKTMWPAHTLHRHQGQDR